MQNCGVVVEAHNIDERSEWRTFSDSVRFAALVAVGGVLQRGLCGLQLRAFFLLSMLSSNEVVGDSAVESMT